MAPTHANIRKNAEVMAEQRGDPDALKGHEGQHVALVVHVDTASGLVQIAQVEPARP